MKISYNWLSDYIPVRIPVAELEQILTSIGLEVESVEKSDLIPGGLEGLVIGEVISCNPHPDADRLQVTSVATGSGNALQIVCGAPNVAAGQKVVVAPVGAHVHPTSGQPFPIKKAKIRGVVSEGMICAADEIGIGTDHEGILVLPEDAVVGQTAKAHFGLPDPDYIIDIGLTPNRSDANSHWGVAQDVCAYLSHRESKTVKAILPDIPEVRPGSERLPLTIQNNATDLCPRYAGVVLSGLKVGPSPEWLQQRLRALGFHPVNHIVDVTNFVLHELGQPLHAFDYDKISGHTVRINTATGTEKFTTLDGTTRQLSEEDLVISDAAAPMCLAGVFGGEHSAVSDSTTRIFLESAYFDPRSIRRSSLHHGLRTEAATHFEKGVRMNMVVPALKRAVSLLTSSAGAQVVSELQDVYPAPKAFRLLTLHYDYLANLCGKRYEPAAVRIILEGLGFPIESETENSITVSVAAENRDIYQPADLAEEILRIDGLDNIVIPTRLNIALNPSRETSSLRPLREKLSQYLAGVGLHEIITNSITNSKYYPGQTDMVALLNNLSSELDVMRPHMLESGLEVIAYNANRKIQDLALFEMGKTYRQAGAGSYKQREWLAIWISGHVTPQSWKDEARKADIYYLKGLLTGILTHCGLQRVQEQNKDGRIIWMRGSEQLASATEVAPQRCQDFDIRQPVFYAELDLEALATAVASAKMQFRPLPKHPAMKRDLALVVPKSTRYEDIARLAKKQKWESLKSFELFDVFENEKLGTDKKSLALSFIFQHQDRTLTDQEVDRMMQQLIAGFEKDLNAFVRT